MITLEVKKNTISGGDFKSLSEFIEKILHFELIRNEYNSKTYRDVNGSTLRLVDSDEYNVVNLMYDGDLVYLKDIVHKFGYNTYFQGSILEIDIGYHSSFKISKCR